MALIAAVFASLIGLAAGIFSAVFLGTTLLQSASLYFCIALATMSVFAMSMMFRAERGSERVPSFEDVLDADWARFSEMEARRMTPEEEEFQAQLDTPLEAGDVRAQSGRGHAHGLGPSDERKVAGTRRGAS